MHINTKVVWHIVMFIFSTNMHTPPGFIILVVLTRLKSKFKNLDYEELLNSIA